MPKHYLLSLPVLEAGTTFHCYLMTNDESDVELMGHKLLEIVEGNFGPPRLPIILSTPLQSTGKGVVRAHVSGNPQAKKLMREATDFHTTIFAMISTDPACEKLMGLH